LAKEAASIDLIGSRWMRRAIVGCLYSATFTELREAAGSPGCQATVEPVYGRAVMITYDEVQSLANRPTWQ
jgi:hypothetical protein